MINKHHLFFVMILPSLFALSLLIVPIPAHAQSSFNLIVCERTQGDPCDFGDLVLLAKNIINFLILISTFLATIAFAYAGFVLLTSGGSESAKTKAKQIFTKVLIGYLWILGAWLLVYTITSALLKSGYSVLGAP